MNKAKPILSLSAVLLALLPLSAIATYPIEVDKKLNKLKVFPTTQAIDKDLGGLTLFNQETSAVRCTAVFRNGPEAPRARRALIEPGSSQSMTIKFNRNIIKLRIALTCEKP